MLRTLITYLLLGIGIYFVSMNVHAKPITVAIDAGHTLKAPGALAAGDGLAELYFNQHMAQLLAIALEQKGVRVVFANQPIRITENFKDRANTSKQADFFISIHHDSANEKWLNKLKTSSGFRYEDHQNQFKGFSLFLSHQAPDLPTSQHCALKMGDALMAIGEKPSLYHADPVKGESRPFFDAARGIHYFDGLAVLRNASTPALLWEVGVIVNLEESRRLRQEAVTKAMAHSVANALYDCLSQVAPSKK